MKRLIYFFYHLKNLDTQKLAAWLPYASRQVKRSKFALIVEMMLDVILYKISFLEYFQFGFYAKNGEQKKNWAGTGYMYEYQLQMNPRTARSILDDKTKFYRSYKPFMVHHVADVADLRQDGRLADALLKNPAGKLVFKEAHGQCGKNIEILPSSKFRDVNELMRYMNEEQFDLVEEYLMQHPALHALSPSAVNTVRIFTQLNENDDVEILGCRQRISVNSKVDNMAAGNLAARIDEVSGKITGPGVYSDITKPEETIHPVSGVAIVGFQIPFWKETIELVKNAARAHPENRSIGWDIVITERGPGLIEGNHDWCKLVWQLPMKEGLKPMLEKYLHHRV